MFLRLVAAFVYIAHRTQKLFGVPGRAFHWPAVAATLMFSAGVLETFGGVRASQLTFQKADFRYQAAPNLKSEL